MKRKIFIVISALFLSFSLCSNSLLMNKSHTLKDLNNLHSYKYDIEIKTEEVKHQDLILLCPAKNVKFKGTVNFSTNYVYSAKKDVLTQAKNEGLSIKEIAPIFNELKSIDESFRTNKIIDSSISNLEMSIYVDGIDNKFGVYGLFYSGYKTLLYKVNTLLDIDGEIYKLNFHFYVFETPYCHVRYFSDMKEFTNYINEVENYD